MFNFKRPRFPSWLNPELEIARMNTIEKDLIRKLELLQDPKLIERIQGELNQIQFAKYRLREVQREFDNV